MAYTMPSRSLSLQEKALQARKKSTAYQPKGLEALRIDRLTREAQMGIPSFQQPETEAEYQAVNAVKEGKAREAFIRNTVDQSKASSSLASKTGLTGSGMWGDFFDSLKAAEASAAWEGKGFNADLSGIGQSSSSRRPSGGSAMPSSRAALAQMGNFDVADDPRVQQALITQALTALEPDEFSYALPGGEMRVASRRDVEQDRQFGRGLDQLVRGTNVKADLAENVADRTEPRQAGRNLSLTRRFDVPQAQADAAVGDVESAAENRRLWDPHRQSYEQQKFDRMRTLATEPAQIAAGSRQAEAGIKGNAAVEAARARQTPQGAQAAKIFGEMVAKGAFGIDAQGRPMSPPAELQQEAIETLMGLLSGQGGAPGVWSPEIARLSPEGRQLLQDVVNNGLAQTVEEALAEYRRRGIPIR